MLTKLIGEQLAQLRWKQQVSLADVSHVMTLSEQYLIEVENGEIDIDLVTLNALCHILGTTCQDVLNNAQAMQEDYSDDARVDDLDIDGPPPAPVTVDDYKKARAWYQTRRQRFLWIRRKRELERTEWRKRREQISIIRSRLEALRNSRTAMGG